MPKKKVIHQKYRKNCQLLDEICKDALDRIRNNNTHSLGVHLPNVTNDDKITLINFCPNRNKYSLAYRDPVYFPGTITVGRFASTRQAAEVQQFIRNQLCAISDKLTIANDVALHNTKTAITIDPKTNKRLPDFVNIGSNGQIIVKKYDEYVSDLKSPVPSRIAYDIRVSTFHADRGTWVGRRHDGNRANKLQKERYELLREEEKNDRKGGCQKFPCKKKPKRQHKSITEDSSDHDRPTIEIEGNCVDADPTTGTILYPGTKLRRWTNGLWGVEIQDFESWIVIDGNAGKTYKEYEVFCNIFDLSNKLGDFNRARQTISAMVSRRDVNIAITELFTTRNSSIRICHGPKRDGKVPCPYLSSLNFKFADVQQRDQTSPFKAYTSHFVSGFLQGDHDNETMWENNSKLEDCENVGYIGLTDMRARKFNQEEFDGQCVEPRCPHCHIMVTADDWKLNIRLDGTNEYRKLKSRMIDEQECWCAGEGDYKGAGKTECPHTDFFGREIAKCITDRDKETLIMGWFIFDHETPMWLAVPPVATTATTPSTATAPAVVSPPSNTRLSRTEHNIAKFNNDASKLCDPETGLPLEAGFIRCRACNYVATQKLNRTRGKQKGSFYYDAVEWFQNQLQLPFHVVRPTPVSNYIININNNNNNKEAPSRIEIVFAMHDSDDTDDDTDADTTNAGVEWFPATLIANNFRSCMFDDNDLTCYALHQIEYDDDRNKYHDVIFIDHENLQIRVLGSLEWNNHHYRIVDDNGDDVDDDRNNNGNADDENETTIIGDGIEIDDDRNNNGNADDENETTIIGDGIEIDDDRNNNGNADDENETTIIGDGIEIDANHIYF